MKKASWILLTFAGVAIILLSLVSAWHAYRTSDDYAIGSSRVSKVAGGDAGLATALRGIRGTSAAYATAYGVLFLAIVLGPYRRGDVWAWKALLVAGFTEFVLVLLRIPLLGTQHGLLAAVLQVSFLVVGLVLGAGRLKGPAR
ncbi:MAG TPA: hypothetical protein VKM94_02175 [Blastocatellia bacterium]|nr:hypothetical protein [Blastocatellia bacterium]